MKTISSNIFYRKDTTAFKKTVINSDNKPADVSSSSFYLPIAARFFRANSNKIFGFKGEDLHSLNKYINDPGYRSYLSKTMSEKELWQVIGVSVPFRDYEDIDYLESVFLSTKENEMPVRMLAIGLGDHGEELFSYTAVINEIADSKGKNLKDVLDLTAVDIRPSCNIKLNPVSYGRCDKVYFDEFEEKSTNKKQFKFKKPVSDFLNSTLGNPRKAYFATPFEYFTRIYKGPLFKIVSCNNVFYYNGMSSDNYDKKCSILDYPSPIRSETPGEEITRENFPQYFNEIERVLELVDINGIVFLHHEDLIRGRVFSHIKDLKENFERLDEDIYKRKRFKSPEEALTPALKQRLESESNINLKH